ncbi:MAG: hypothetical protein OXC15_14415, partial [Rhodospirillaceae bacterium]|nr:hypothetical protein [Rhodospirillaceae bacterium]
APGAFPDIAPAPTDDTIENALDMFLSVSGMTHSPHLRTSDPAAIVKQARRVANRYRKDNESSVWITGIIVSIPETPHAANPAAAHVNRRKPLPKA